jgi:hypothetical protein
MGFKDHVMLLRINRLVHTQRTPHGVAGTRVGPRPEPRDVCHGWERAGTALRRIGAASLFVAILASTAQADPRSDLAQARHDLAISEQVLARVSERVNAARSDPATAPEERRRLDEYLARVRDLVELNRERVRALAQTVDFLPAGASTGGTGGIGTSPAATDAEEVAALDAKLSGSLAEFDQLLLEEARKARARAPTRASAAGSMAGSSGEATGRTAPKSGADGSSAAGGTASGDGNTDPRPSGKGPGSPGGRIEGTEPGAAGPRAAVPPDVGDGSDDDIVARQIRRAAEAETDPELRKKLWDEYRKYKQGTKG